ncbi:hypothetical protein KCU79_g22218, partial [Aureobasidium melanogenum]
MVEYLLLAIDINHSVHTINLREAVETQGLARPIPLCTLHKDRNPADHFDQIRDPPVTRTIPQYRQDSGPPVTRYAHQEPISSWADEVSPTYPSLDMPRPFAGTQRDSSGSSIYSLPDFPIPQAPQVPQQVARPSYQPNRRPPLGPPPSARKGPASYYPQTNYVAPILEETDSQRGLHDSKSSFASSNAIPIGISKHLADQHDMRQDKESPFRDQFEDSDSEPEQ